MIGVSVAKKRFLEPSDMQEVGEMIVTTDYLGAGNSIGELGFLTGSRRNSSCTCETSVQVGTRAAVLIANATVLPLLGYPGLNHTYY